MPWGDIIDAGRSRLLSAVGMESQIARQDPERILFLYRQTPLESLAARAQALTLFSAVSTAPGGNRYTLSRILLEELINRGHPELFPVLPGDVAAQEALTADRLRRGNALLAQGNGAPVYQPAPAGVRPDPRWAPLSAAQARGESNWFIDLMGDPRYQAAVDFARGFRPTGGSTRAVGSNSALPGAGGGQTNPTAVRRTTVLIGDPPPNPPQALVRTTLGARDTVLVVNQSQRIIITDLGTTQNGGTTTQSFQINRPSSWGTPPAQLRPRGYGVVFSGPRTAADRATIQALIDAGASAYRIPGTADVIVFPPGTPASEIPPGAYPYRPPISGQGGPFVAEDPAGDDKGVAFGPIDPGDPFPDGEDFLDDNQMLPEEVAAYMSAVTTSSVSGGPPGNV